MNEIMNNILTRRSIRKFTDAPVSKEILDDLVQAALHAPSGCGKQTWKFTVITNKAAIRRLADAIRTTLDRPGYNMYCPTAIIMPSITACGSPSSTERSMNAPGSPSSALQMTYLTSASTRRAKSHLRPVG